jgi:hypothetical protein
MNRPRTLQELVHWLEVGTGARWVRLAACLVGALALSLTVAWKQFHGATSEVTLLQADLGRQLAEGEGFTTLVNYPQSSAVLEARGRAFSATQAYPELSQAPLYSIAIAAAIRVLPSEMRESLFTAVPVVPDGYGGDYVLLGLNLVLFWIALALTFELALRLFSVRAAWLAMLALMFSVTAWQQVVAVNGTPLLMMLALVAFRAWWAAEAAADAGVPRIAVAIMGLASGLLFLAEYSAGVLVLIALGWAALRFSGRNRLVALALVAAGFILPAAPWIVRNLALTGSPVALASQNVALKAGDPTAEPALLRTRLSTESPRIELRKLGNKALTGLQGTIQTHLWSGGGLFLSAFFVAGWLYGFKTRTTNRLRWLFTFSFAALVAGQAFLNSGESERLAVFWLAPLIVTFGAGFFFVLLDANSLLREWPRLVLLVLLAVQALPLARDALEPRRLHFTYPPYFPQLLIGLREEIEQRGALNRFGAMADIPAGAAWYGRHRVWAQPERLRDFQAIMVKQPVGALLLTPRTLDRPFLSELGARGSALTSIRGGSDDRFGEWGQIYGALLTGRMPAGFPLTERQPFAENLYVLLNPALPRLQ